MRKLGLVRVLGLIFCCAFLNAAEDPREIVRRAIDVDHRNNEIAQNYTYVERQEQRQIDGSGNVTKRQSKTFDITYAGGVQYRRLIARNDQPLPPEEEAKERQKLEASLKETPEQRQARLAELESKRQKLREAIAEVLDAYDFRLAGEDRVAGREVYVVEGTPKPGYRPRTKIGKYYPKLKGRLWIDKEDYFWVKAETELIDTISWGLFLARIQKGTHFTAEQTRVNGEVWLPKHIAAFASARLALFKKLDIQWEMTCRDYRKFQSDSQVVSAEPIAQ